jgi:hypothetical protein
MPASVDTILFTLAVALTPAGERNERLFAGIGNDLQAQQEREAADGARDPGACRYFVDPEARRKCVVRTSRAGSGAAEPPPSFPEATIWIAPEEPRMPPRLPATQR